MPTISHMLSPYTSHEPSHPKNIPVNLKKCLKVLVGVPFESPNAVDSFMVFYIPALTARQQLRWQRRSCPRFRHRCRTPSRITYRLCQVQAQSWQSVYSATGCVPSLMNAPRRNYYSRPLSDMLYRNAFDLQAKKPSTVSWDEENNIVNEKEEFDWMGDEVTLHEWEEDNESYYSLDDAITLQKHYQIEKVGQKRVEGEDRGGDGESCYIQEDAVQAILVEDFEGEKTKGHYVVFPRLCWKDEVTLPRSFRLTFTWVAESVRQRRPKFTADAFVHGQVQYGNFKFVMDDPEHVGRQTLNNKCTHDPLAGHSPFSC